MVLKVPSVFFQLVTICRHHCDDRDEPPLPSKLALKKKKVPGKRNFLKGFIFFANVFPLTGKGKLLSSLCSHTAEEGARRGSYVWCQWRQLIFL